MRDIPLKAIQSIPLFQRASMSLFMIHESISWKDELLSKANGGCVESIVDSVKLKNEGLPSRFFDKREFDLNLIQEFNQKYKLRLQIYESPTEPPCYILLGTDHHINQGEVLLLEQLSEYMNKTNFLT